MPYDFVDMNNDSSVYNIVSHLSQMGHEDVGIVTGLYETSNFTHRRISFEKSLKLFGLNGRGEHYFTVDSTYEGLIKVCWMYLPTDRSSPRLFFCVNDIIALGCVRALKESGYKVPDDVSVVGFDDLPMSSMSEPTLTTVKVSKQRISMNAVKLLTQRIEEGSNMPYEKVLIGGEVVERESVKDISGGFSEVGDE